MPLPDERKITKMQYAKDAIAFVNCPSKSNINTLRMQYAFMAQPFVCNPYLSTANFMPFFG